MGRARKKTGGAPTSGGTWAQKPAKIIDKGDAVEEMSPEEIEPMLSERIEKWSQELRCEGWAEGKAEGKAVGRAELFISLFERKLGPIPDDLRERALSADAETIVLLIERLATAKTPADLFAASSEGAATTRTR